MMSPGVTRPLLAPIPSAHALADALLTRHTLLTAPRSTGSLGALTADRSFVSAATARCAIGRPPVCIGVWPTVACQRGDGFLRSTLGVQSAGNAPGRVPNRASSCVICAATSGRLTADAKGSAAQKNKRQAAQSTSIAPGVRCRSESCHQAVATCYDVAVDRLDRRVSAVRRERAVKQLIEVRAMLLGHFGPDDVSELGGWGQLPSRRHRP
jgi:hypothetical protein